MSEIPSKPNTRKEAYLAAAAGQSVEYPAKPITREEAYLKAIAEKPSGGGGTTDYERLENKPSIGGVELVGNQTAAQLGLATEQALSGKQDALTAGDYINLNNGNISVNRNIVGDNYDYEIKSTGDYRLTIIKSQGGTVISTNTYDYSYGTSTNIDNNFTIAGAYSGGNTWVYTALKDSTTHSVGYTWTKSVDASFEETESFPSEDLSGYKLVIKSEMDEALAGLGGVGCYVETHTAQSSANFSHTFLRQPKAILQIHQPYTPQASRPYFTSVPIVFDDEGNLISTSIVVVNNSGQTAYRDISWNKNTLTLTYTGSGWDDAFGRANSKIVYLA